MADNTKEYKGKFEFIRHAGATRQVKKHTEREEARGREKRVNPSDTDRTSLH